ncbi:MAG: hypothetical protein WDZ51_19795 [Pirellulaceae bacterium]
MGHQRLGKIPKSKAFAEVVALISGAPGEGGGIAIIEDVQNIAAATLVAAEAGLNQARDDSGLCDTFYLLTQLVLAARDEKNWRERFADLGISLSDDAGMFELVSEIQYTLQDRSDQRNAYSDIAEMARKSAIDAVKSLAGPHSTTLFGTGPDELRDAVRKLSTKKGFAELGRTFFGGVLSQYLNFYICKETPNAVREGRLDGMEGLREFEDALDRHCYQSAKIVQNFCGDWYSKTEWREGIDPQNTSRAVAFAIEKLQRELRQQGGDK